VVEGLLIKKLNKCKGLMRDENILKIFSGKGIRKSPVETGLCTLKVTPMKNEF
jgi:hypothetical protein